MSTITNLESTVRSVTLRFTQQEVREAIIADDYALWSEDEIERLVGVIAPYEWVGIGFGVDGAVENAYRRMLDVLNILYRVAAL